MIFQWNEEEEVFQRKDGRTVEFPLYLEPMNCCGLMEGSSSDDTLLYTKENFRTWLGKMAYCDNGRDAKGLLKSGGILATAIDRQEEYKKWLRKVGFKKLSRFLNNNTGNMVELYIYVLFPPLKKKKGE